MERPSPVASIRTLFDVLGLPPDASAHQIEAAWHQHVVDAEGRYDRVPDEIRAAYGVLHNATNRALYRDLLRCCETGSLVTQAADKLTKFTSFCKQCGLTVHPVPKVPNTYALRAPWQDPPDWTEPRPTPPTRLATGLDYLIRKFLLGGVFRGKTRWQRCGLALVYVTVIGLGYLGGQRLVARWHRYQRDAHVAAQNAFQRDVREEHRKLSGKLAELKQANSALTEDFRRITGVTFDQAADPAPAWSGDFNRVLLERQSVADALSEMLRSRVTPDELGGWERERDDGATAIQAGNFAPLDPERLRQLLAQVQSRLDWVAKQRRNLGVIREIVAASHSTSTTPDVERETP